VSDPVYQQTDPINTKNIEDFDPNNDFKKGCPNYDKI
jgi:hypothetical protein